MKTKVGKLGITESVHVPTGLNNLKAKVDDLGVDKLKIVPDDLGVDKLIIVPIDLKRIEKCSG